MRQITAKYASVCSKCGCEINPGDKINYEKGKKPEHVTCPFADVPTYRMAGGSGYGYSGWTKGQVLRNAAKRIEKGEPEYLFVLSACSEYIREEGMSFGVGDEEGHYYTAVAREATDEESAPVRAAIAEREAIVEKGKALDTQFREIFEAGEYPDPADGSYLPDGVTIPVGKGQDLYGGGSWFVVGPEWTWAVRNNGMDGDDWSRNNVRTGGAGAIGFRIPTTNELLAFFRAYNPDVPSEAAPFDAEPQAIAPTGKPLTEILAPETIPDPDTTPDPQTAGRAWGKLASKRLRNVGKRNCAGLSKSLFACAARNQGRGQVWYLAAAFGVLEGR